MEDLTIVDKVFAKTIDSREVAEMLNKEHWQVLRDIEGSKDRRGIIQILNDNQLVVVNYFIESSYSDDKGEIRKCYLVTKMGCELLGNKQQGEKGILFTAKYVKKFNEMEQQIKNSYMIEDPIKRAERWIQEEKQRQLLALKIEQDKPKVEYCESVLDSSNLSTTTEIASEYGKSAQQFNKLLNGLGIIRKVGGTWVLRTEYTGKGYEHIDRIPIKHNDGENDFKSLLKWTENGRYFLYNKLKENGIERPTRFGKKTNIH